MVKKHIPNIQELYSLLKKCVQDHKVIPFHRIEELKDTFNKILFIEDESNSRTIYVCCPRHTILLGEYSSEEEELITEAQIIIEQFNHKDCGFYEGEDTDHYTSYCDSD